MKRERAQLSAKNPCHIPKHRYYELKHFCLQYPNGFDLPMPRHIVFPKRKLDPISDLQRQATGQIRIRAACSLHLNGTIVIHRAVIGFRVLNGLAGI